MMKACFGRSRARASLGNTHVGTQDVTSKLGTASYPLGSFLGWVGAGRRHVGGLFLFLFLLIIFASGTRSGEISNLGSHRFAGC